MTSMKSNDINKSSLHNVWNTPPTTTSIVSQHQTNSISPRLSNNRDFNRSTHTTSSSISSISSSLSTSFSMPPTAPPPGFIDPWKTFSTRKNDFQNSNDVHVDQDQSPPAGADLGYFSVRSVSVSNSAITASLPSTPSENQSKWMQSPDLSSVSLTWTGSSPWAERSKSIAVPLSSVTLPHISRDDPLSSSNSIHSSGEIPYRTQRSMSFAIGQGDSDPTFSFSPNRDSRDSTSLINGMLGTANINTRDPTSLINGILGTGNTNTSTGGFLAPMAEEDDTDDTLPDDYSQYSMSLPKHRSRSKSSVAAFTNDQLQNQLQSHNQNHNQNQNDIGLGSPWYKELASSQFKEIPYKDSTSSQYLQNQFRHSPVSSYLGLDHLHPSTTPPTGHSPALKGLSPERERLERLRSQRRFSLSPIPLSSEYRTSDLQGPDLRMLNRPMTEAEMAQLGIRRHSVAAPGLQPPKTMSSTTTSTSLSNAAGIAFSSLDASTYLLESMESLRLDSLSPSKNNNNNHLGFQPTVGIFPSQTSTSPSSGYSNLMENVNDYFENDTHRRMQVNNAMAAHQAAAAAAVLARQQTSSPFGGNSGNRGNGGISSPPKNISSMNNINSTPLNAIPPNAPLYIVEFKAGRCDLFYLADYHGPGTPQITIGDLVIVEADRGKDLGKVIQDQLTPFHVQAFQQRKVAESTNNIFGDGGPNSNSNSKDMQAKRLFRLAQPPEVATLMAKAQDELKALKLCQSKVHQRHLPMEVVDAEYQWDRRKLTFYFVAERRIDFRELVRDLFKIYKTRIWMMSTNRGLY